MTTTITRLFDSRSDAQHAVKSLEAMGIARDDISVVASGQDNDDGTSDGHGIGDVNEDGDVSRGASTGAVIGGVGGLLAGLGLLAIPGLGPVVAAGWLVTAVAGAGLGAAGGAATGSIVGALRHAGHSEEDANVYAEGVRRGGTLLSARVPDDLASQIEASLRQYNSVDAATRGADYRAGGWTRFDEDADYSVDDAHRSEGASVGNKIAGMAKQGFGAITGDDELKRRGELQQDRSTGL